MMVRFGRSGTLAYEQMDQAYAAVREQFDAVRDGEMQEVDADSIRQLCSLQNRIVMAGETTYIALSVMELQEDGLERIDLEQDLKTAKENSWDFYLAAKVYTDAQKDYNDHGSDYGQTCKANNRSYQQTRHNCYAARYTYDKKVQDFELDLRRLYLKVLDNQQIREAAQAALAAELENRSAAQLKYDLDFLAENALRTAEDKVTQAEEKLASVEYDLFSAYNTCRWAVDYGIC